MNIEDIDFSKETRKKAAHTLMLTLVKPDKEHPDTIWWVISARDRTITYRVQADLDVEKATLSWWTCTCPHGLRTGGGHSLCYHACAALDFAILNHNEGDPV